MLNTIKKSIDFEKINTFLPNTFYALTPLTLGAIIFWSVITFITR